MAITGAANAKQQRARWAARGDQSRAPPPPSSSVARQASYRRVKADCFVNLRESAVSTGLASSTAASALSRRAPRVYVSGSALGSAFRAGAFPAIKTTAVGNRFHSAAPLARSARVKSSSCKKRLKTPARCSASLKQILILIDGSIPFLRQPPDNFPPPGVRQKAIIA